MNKRAYIEDVMNEKIIGIEYEYEGKETYQAGKYEKDITLVLVTETHFIIFLDAEYAGDSASYIVEERIV